MRQAHCATPRVVSSPLDDLTAPPPRARPLNHTQLDTLAGMPRAGRRVGEVLVNGVPRRPMQIRAMTCYVQQTDVLAPSATVRSS